MIYNTTTLEQIALNSLGFGPLLVDGDNGPKTKDARARWLASAGLPSVIANNMVHIAIEQAALNIREETKNQGPGIAKFWTATSYPNGYANREPYCAAFVCWSVREACKGVPISFSLPTSPVAYDVSKWAAANKGKGVETIGDPLDAKPGDIFTLATASHTGLVVGVEGGLLHTVEGNTDGSGSREGDGVYQRTRAFSSIRSLHRITG